MEIKKPRTKVSRRQQELMVTFFEEHPELNKGVLTNTFTAKTKQQLWQDLTDILNSDGSCVKTVDKWIKCWSDYKQDFKKRYSQREQYKNCTGGGPPPKDLSELDWKVLSLIGTDGYFGNVVKDVAPPLTLYTNENQPADVPSSSFEATFQELTSQVSVDGLLLETSQPQSAASPEAKEERRARKGLKRRRLRGMVIPPEKRKI